jgi:group II intron reverse transcriptase/maturase
MNADGKSDEFVIPSTQVNNAGTEPGAESVEERDSAKRNAERADLHRTPRRNKRRSLGLSGVRMTARAQPELKFTSLLHHVNEQLLTEAFFNLKKTAAVGVDEVTWQDYEVGLEERITDLHGRIHRGAYRAKPSKRIYIAKPDGRQRPIGIASLEDKLVQKAVVWVMQCIYEVDFLGFSYGYRPGKSQHMALDALSVGLSDRKVNWVLDADVEGFFDNIDHEWLMKFLEHRIADDRLLRLIRKWLRAGISEEGQWSETTVGTPQGAVASPLLANVFLHYVFDLWIQWWRSNRARGDVVVIRFADDFVIGFEHQHEAQRCLDELHTRFAKFGLKLHEQKTRLIEFGRHAARRRQARGAGRTETFDFLGFTHRCDVTSAGWFALRRETIAKRLRATIAAIKVKLIQRRHWPIKAVGKWLGQVARGWMNYHAIPGNWMRMKQFLDEVKKLWLHQLRRRSQRHRWSWTRFVRMFHRYLPEAKVLHPFPSDRFRARLEAGAV